MLKLIGEAQSAFVQNWQTLDGALIANEAIWWIKKKKMKATMLKVDFHKAYNTIKWSFIDRVLELMGSGAK